MAIITTLESIGIAIKPKTLKSHITSIIITTARIGPGKVSINQIISKKISTSHKFTANFPIEKRGI